MPLALASYYRGNVSFLISLSKILKYTKQLEIQ